MKESHSGRKNRMDEISLRELIEIVFKRKTIILGFALAAVLIAGIYSFLIAETVYDAEVTIEVPNLTMIEPETQAEGLEGFLDSISITPPLDLAWVRNEIRTTKVLQKTLRDTNLEEEYTEDELSNKLAINRVEESSSVRIRIRDENSSNAALLAEAFGENAVEAIRESLEEIRESTIETIENQMAMEKDRLDQALKEKQEFVGQPRGINELSREVEANFSQLTQLKTILREQKIEQDALSKAVEIIDEELANVEPTIDTRDSEEVNELYTILREHRAINRSQYEQTNSRIASIEREIELIEESLGPDQRELQEKELRNLEISQKVEISESRYFAFSAKYQELESAETFGQSSSEIQIISGEGSTVRAISTNRKLNVIIAAIVGLGAGVFAGFFVEYWEATGSSLEEKKRRAKTNQKDENPEESQDLKS